MATLTRGQNFAVTETVTNTKLHNLVDLATVTGIVDADISPSAAIQFSKLLASSISGALLTNLNLIPSAAGIIPYVNIPATTLVSIPNQSLLPLTLASWVDGVALRNLASTPVDKQIRYNLLVSSLASGDIPAYNGANNFVGSTRVLLADALAGDTLNYDDDGEVTVTGLSYAAIKTAVYIPRTGVYRIKFSMHASQAGFNVYGRLYKNGAGFGTARNNTSATYIEYSEDLSFTKGDLLTLQGYVDSESQPAKFQNFRIYNSADLISPYFSA